MLTKNKSPVACFFGFLLIILILSLSIGVTHAFAKDKKISGYVRTSSGNEISGVTITFSNVEGSTTTDNSGYYSQKVKEGWSGTATPFKVGYDFDPAYLSYSNVKRGQKDQDYIGTLQTRTISGYIRTLSGYGISEVSVAFDNGGGTETTNISGYYAKSLDKGWGGTVTPIMEGYNFDPAFQSYSNITTNQSNQDYTGAQVQQTVMISGNVRTSSGNGIDGVAVTFSDGGETAVTNSSGYYAKNLDKGWGGTVTTVKEGYRFIPEYRNYSNVKVDQLNQDYAGYVESAEFRISIDIVGSGNIRIDPEQDIYTENSTISLSAIADMGWVFSEWRGDLESSNNQENVSIISDMFVKAVFLEDYDNDGVSDEEENSNPINGDGNRDGILDSLQSNVASSMLYSANSYVTLETPISTSINEFRMATELSNTNYPSDVQFSYGFFSFALKGIPVGDSTAITLYFPTDVNFNTYYKYGPTIEDRFNHWYEFLYENQIGAVINENIITLHFVDGKKGDDDLTEDGNIIDLGGPGIRITTSPEPSSKEIVGDTDSYGCFVECLY
jgi:hypothetical protein